MIVCVIEFAVEPGMEARNLEMLNMLLPVVAQIDGFISKESFDSRNNPGKVLTISTWRDMASLQAWMRDKTHMIAKRIGKDEVFSSYTIRIAEVKTEHSWSRSGT